MSNRLKLVIQICATVLLVSFHGHAQSQDRSRTLQEIESLHEQLKQKEAEFLSPSAEDRALFGAFLSQPDTGIARLLPRGKYGDKLSIREGGAYYSFTKLSNSYNEDPQIGLEQGMLSTG